MAIGFVRLKVLSDGMRDYIEVPGGPRFTLGAVSVAKAVVSLALSTHEARAALDAFNKTGMGSFMGDLGRLPALLERRPVLAKALIPRGDRIPSAMERTVMAYDDATKAAIAQQVSHIEAQISLLSAKAKEASSGSISEALMKDEIEKLRSLVAWVKRPSPYGDQSKNDTYYGLGKTAAVNLKANTELATHTLRTVEATSDRIDRLREAGKRFNSVRAKADLHRIASQVSEIVSNVDLSADWVRNDLLSLSKRADEIHGLFPKDA
jgi:hypothetical protein